MLRRITHRCLLACLLALLYADGDISDIAPRASAQTATPVVSPQPTPLPQQQEPIKIYTEEVILPVVATDSSGRFDPTLELNDLLVWRTANHRQYGAFDEFPPAFSCCWTPAASEIRR